MRRRQIVVVGIGISLGALGPGPARGDDSFEVQDGQVLSGGTVVGELPRGLVPQALQGGPTGQNLTVIGQVPTAPPGAMPPAGMQAMQTVQLTYGRTLGLGDLRLVTGAQVLQGGGSPSGSLAVNLPARTYYMSDRVLRLTFAPAQSTTAQRGILITLAAGAESVHIDSGTCRATTFLAGPLFSAPTPATDLVLSTNQNRLVLWARQQPPGEDCVASLITAAGAAPLRIIGQTEGGGSTVVLADRSWSMERPLAGAPDGSSRAAALRQALRVLLGALSALPAGSVGQWAVLPFSDGKTPASTAPSVGLAEGLALTNPDLPGALHVQGFGGSATDELTPEGTTDVAQALALGIARLQGDAGALVSGGHRRLWVWSDGLAGPAPLAEESLVGGLLGAGAALRLLGIAGPLQDPRWQGVLGRTGGLAGPLAPPPGEYALPDSLAGVSEAVVSALVAEVLGGRGIGRRAVGAVQVGTSLETGFQLTSSEPWVLALAAWEHADAAMQMSFMVNNIVARGPCARAGTAQVCVAPGYAGLWQVHLSGSAAGGGAEPALVAAFVAGSGTAGQVAMSAGFGQALYRSGDTMRLVVRLSEQGLPLLQAKVTATVTMQQAAAGGIVAAAPAAHDQVAALVESSGDLSPGQARWELAQAMPTLSAAGKPVQLTLNDSGQDGDNQTEDGTYVASLVARVPGPCRVDLHIEHSGVFTPPGVIERHLETQVVVGLDLGRTGDSVKAQRLGADSLRVTVTPQDRFGQLLGPGQADGLRFYAAGQKPLSGPVGDLLDGGYVADLSGVGAGPVELETVGGRIVLLNKSQVSAAPGGGCSASAATGTAASLPLGLALAVLGLLLRRRAG